jgi:hypothetical protein
MLIYKRMVLAFSFIFNIFFNCFDPPSECIIIVFLISLAVLVLLTGTPQILIFVVVLSFRPFLMSWFDYPKTSCSF